MRGKKMNAMKMMKILRMLYLFLGMMSLLAVVLNTCILWKHLGNVLITYVFVVIGSSMSFTMLMLCFLATWILPKLKELNDL